MTVSEQINKDYIVAYKAKEQTKIAALKSAKAPLADIDKTAKEEVPASVYYKALTKVINQYRETAEFAQKASNDELATQSLAEAAVLQAYIPPQLTEAEVEVIVKKVVVDNKLAFAKPHMGAIVKHTQTIAEGRTDGKTISTIVNKLIAEEIGKYGSGL